MNRLKFHQLLWLKLPIAKIAGIRPHHFSAEKAEISVKLRWLNQNPFNSMFWAVQGMAAELSTAVLCFQKIKESQQNISMLVVGLEAKFTKKAVGKIIFTCEQGEALSEVLNSAINTGQGQTLIMKSIGRDEKGDQVAEFQFQWSFKVRGER